MATYVVGASIVNDSAGLGEYQSKAAAVLARYSSRFIAGGTVTVLEWDFHPTAAPS